MAELPRIDVARKALQTTLDLLQQCAKEIDDLHALAYERRTGADGIKVRVTRTEWALDTHGDPIAREAYRRLLGAVLATYQPVDAAARDVVRILRDGDRPGRVLSARTASAAEVAAAIAAQARRAARGEYTPVRVLPQPDPGEIAPDTALEGATSDDGDEAA